MIKKIQQEISEEDLLNYNKDLKQFETDLNVKLKKIKRIFVLTSGGTKVKLSKDNNYILDNFSTGTRGSLICESLVKKNELVVFLYRKKSKLPFETEITSEDDLEEIKQHFEKVNNKIIFIEFEFVHEYLYKLVKIEEILDLNLESKKIIFIYAAAVSDFFIKKENLLTNLDNLNKQKINLNLNKMVKTLGFLKQKVKRNIFFSISFKLETDEKILERKVFEAFEKSGSDIIIGNLLQTRYNEIYYYFKRENCIKLNHIKNNNTKNILEKTMVELILDYI